MALVIYSNGILEEYLPVEDTFTDEELVKSFYDYSSIESFRFPEIVNSWCVWGHMDNPLEHEYNKIASEIVDGDVYSHIMIIHDSELNPSWKVTDDILYHPYKKFMEDLAIYISELLAELTQQTQTEIPDSEKSSMIFLTTMGHTKDKRVMFAFNPNEQHENFYIGGGFSTFAAKIYDYLIENFDKEPIEENKPFVIYSDSKTIVIIEDKDVEQVIGDMLEDFTKKEKYEACIQIKDIKNKWYALKTIPKDLPTVDLPKKRRGRPPKNKAD